MSSFYKAVVFNFSPGPRSEVFYKARELYDVPELVRIALSAYQGPKKTDNKRHVFDKDISDANRDRSKTSNVIKYSPIKNSGKRSAANGYTLLASSGSIHKLVPLNIIFALFAVKYLSNAK